ncbi:hypothetical protein BpHYR1_007587 [Brachionus plicatilis]|uniref:Uncharacterized protein n=1 Tax=Brachionus plicatilis TaxID=10195 RepID=A0A3M7R196_BRAPC|nr:hypothetical protein BpHYR1_007587 [Brachionus plicatilis]
MNENNMMLMQVVFTHISNSALYVTFKFIYIIYVVVVFLKQKSILFNLISSIQFSSKAPGESHTFFFFKFDFTKKSLIQKKNSKQSPLFVRIRLVTFWNCNNSISIAEITLIIRFSSSARDKQRILMKKALSSITENRPASSGAEY